MDLKVTLNKVTARALLFLIFASLRLLSLEKLAILFLPFTLINDSTSFLLNIGLIPIAFLLLVMVSLIKFWILVRDKIYYLFERSRSRDYNA
jgi:hypothetical protein